MYPVFAWALKAAMCGGIDGGIKILKTAPTYLVKHRTTYTIFHIMKTQEATDNIERLQQHKSLDTTRSAARIVPSRRKKQHNMVNLLANT